MDSAATIRDSWQGSGALIGVRSSGPTKSGRRSGEKSKVPLRRFYQGLIQLGRLSASFRQRPIRAGEKTVH